MRLCLAQMAVCLLCCLRAYDWPLHASLAVAVLVNSTAQHCCRGTACVSHSPIISGQQAQLLCLLYTAGQALADAR